MPKTAPPADSLPLSTLRTHHPSTLLPPEAFHVTEPAEGSSSDLVHLSKETSRQPSPFAAHLSHPDHFQSRREEEGVEDGDSDYDHWDDTGGDGEDMPSDLRAPLHRQMSGHHAPLLPGDKQQDHDRQHSPSQPLSHRRSARLHERDPDEMARAATRKRYTYAACFLAVSLVSFAVQTETAVYIQHNLGWKKAYCML